MGYYDSITDLATRKAFHFLDEVVRRFSVATQVQYLTITFPATANLDQIVVHKLTPPTAEGVYYEVVRADRACRVYDDQSATRRPWAMTYLILRCDTASAAVTLRLFVKA
jgi:hypothetical protein